MGTPSSSYLSMAANIFFRSSGFFSTRSTIVGKTFLSSSWEPLISFSSSLTLVQLMGMVASVPSRSKT
jgi:hypothetical protein